MKRTMATVALFCAFFILCLSFSPASAEEAGVQGDGQNDDSSVTKEELIESLLEIKINEIEAKAKDEFNKEKEALESLETNKLQEKIDEYGKKDELAENLKNKIDKMSEIEIKKIDKGLDDLAKEGEIHDPKHDTRFFLVHHGAVFVSPYKITKTVDTTVTPNTTTFTIEDSGSTDTNYFLEAYGRYRHAFLGNDCKRMICLDYDGRLGLVAGSKDAAAAVVKGAGNAYFDMSLGLLFNVKGKRNHNLQVKREDNYLTYSINPEFIVGGVTDKGNQDVNLHWGGGLSFVAGIPYQLFEDDAPVLSITGEEQHRKTEFLLGGYIGEADLPSLLNGSTRELVQEHGYARYDTETVYIFKGEFNVPVKKQAYLTIHSKFLKKKNGENINPWTVSLGLTVPLESLADSVSSLFRGESGERAEIDTETN